LPVKRLKFLIIIPHAFLIFFIPTVSTAIAFYGVAGVEVMKGAAPICAAR
jgi:hypothetical protein